MSICLRPRPTGPAAICAPIDAPRHSAASGLSITARIRLGELSVQPAFIRHLWPCCPSTGSADGRLATPYRHPVNSGLQERVAAILAAYEAQSIDADELHGRLLKAIHVAGSTEPARGRLHDLLSAVDEATDSGRNQREEIAWAAASFWRGMAEDS